MQSVRLVRKEVFRFGVRHNVLVGCAWDTHRQLINVLGTRSEDRYAQVVHKAPEICGIVEGTAVVQNQGAAYGQSVHQKVPHHPPADHPNWLSVEGCQARVKGSLTWWCSRRTRHEAGGPRR